MSKTIKGILVINSGSSSIKFSLFTCHAIKLLYHGIIKELYTSPCINILNSNHETIFSQHITTQGHHAALDNIFLWLSKLSDSIVLQVVGHRVVHGGQLFFRPTLVTKQTLEAMADFIPLAPLHQPHNLEAIKIIQNMFPQLPQIACFDTAFHLSQNKISQLFAIPRKLTSAGIIRYGFHGLSYEYIASTLVDKIGDIGNKRVIIAHLGNGASMCAMHKRKSIATSMGFTALDGLMMGTRCGRIDPGVILYLLEKKQYTIKEVQHLLYNESGLLGVSDISSNMHELLTSHDPRAKEAINLFCYRAALEFGSLLVALNGCDLLVFTAGIGENSWVIRQKICHVINFLGIKIDINANKTNATLISEPDSSIMVSVISTDEEYMIAKHSDKYVRNMTGELFA